MLIETAFGQELQTVRLEVPADLDTESYHVESLGKKGVLIFYESNELSKEKKRKWYFGLFNTSLQQDWLKFVDLENKMQFVKTIFSSNKVHLLFRNSGRGRTETGYYEIVSLDLKTEKFEIISGTFPAKAEIVDFEVIGFMGCMGVNLRESETDLLFINLNTGDINPVKLEEVSDSFIETVYANTIDKNFYVALKVKKDNRYITDYIYRFSMHGNTNDVIEIKKETNLKVLRKFQFVNTSNKQLAVFGIYDLFTGKLPSFADMDDEDNPKSAGMFFFTITANTASNIKFHDFLSLDNIHGSISDRKVTMVKPEDSDLNSTGSKKYASTFYNINKPQVIYEPTKGFIFSAEIYKPHYRSETRMDYDFYGRPYPYTYSVFDGYLFFDLIIVSMTEDGNLLWNNDFILRDLKSFSLERHTSIFKDDHFVTAAYVNQGRIYSQTFDQSIDMDSDESMIASNHQKDRVVEDENNHIINWYDNYFLVYGYQKINNRSLSKQNERITFYLNKVAFK